jgi:hypothetical protein
MPVYDIQRIVDVAARQVNISIIFNDLVDEFKNKSG